MQANPWIAGQGWQPKMCAVNSNMWPARARVTWFNQCMVAMSFAKKNPPETLFDLLMHIDSR
jgi:hypothetical protein